MNNIIVLTDGDNKAVGTDDLSSLNPGEFTVLCNGGQVYDTPNEVKDFQFVVGITTSPEDVNNVVKYKTTVAIPRKDVINLTKQVAETPVVPVWKIGGTTTTDTLMFQDEGEASIMIKNLSYNHNIAFQTVFVNLYKKASETVSAFVDRLVLELNKENPTGSSAFVQRFFTATKINSGNNYGIELTALNEHIKFSVTLGGMFELASSILKTAPKFGLGQGIDVLRYEKECSGNLGNGGYAYLPDLYYKQPLQANKDITYTIYNLSWQGTHSLPQNKVNSAVNNLMIAIETGEEGEFDKLLQELVGNRFTSDSGEETALEDNSNYVDEQPID